MPASKNTPTKLTFTELSHLLLNGIEVQANAVISSYKGPCGTPASPDLLVHARAVAKVGGRNSYLQVALARDGRRRLPAFSGGRKAKQGQREKATIIEQMALGGGATTQPLPQHMLLHALTTVSSVPGGADVDEASTTRSMTHEPSLPPARFWPQGLSAREEQGTTLERGQLTVLVQQGGPEGLPVDTMLIGAENFRDVLDLGVLLANPFYQ